MGMPCFTTAQVKILENSAVNNSFLPAFVEKASLSRFRLKESLPFVDITYCSLSTGLFSKLGKKESSNEMLLI